VPSYSLENNAFWVFEVYEVAFSLYQSDRFVAEYYGQFRGMIDVLNQYHTLTTDLETAR